MKVNEKFKINEDIEFFLEAERIKLLDLSKLLCVSRTTLNEILNDGIVRKDVFEKFYSLVYEKKYRLNKIKEEILKENCKHILFHGSKNGLEEVSIDLGRSNCDFGAGFYLGENYSNALSFVCAKQDSSVYSFKYDLTGLNVLNFKCNLEWMLAICYYRGTINSFSNNEIIRKIVEKVSNADVIIAPIADNKMFYIMTQFTDGEINADVALHSLSASNLGLQYVFKTEKALKRLETMERYYVSSLEKNDCKKSLIERTYEIDTKLKLAKREFRNGLYIEEILK